MDWQDFQALEALLNSRLDSSPYIKDILIPVLDELNLYNINISDFNPWLRKHTDLSTYEKWKLCQKSPERLVFNLFWEQIEDLRGATLVSCEQVGDREIHFKTTTGQHFILGHRSNCCETVYIQDICGDLNDLVGSPLIESYESSSNDDDRYCHWTFYILTTHKGSITIRFNGEGDSYYYSLKAAFWEVGD